MNTMPITMLNGLGCGCQQSFPMNGVNDYDTLLVGGQRYSANQILDKTLFAKVRTAIYMNGNWKAPAYYVQPGQPIGKVYSYLKPNDARGGKSALMFYNASNQAYYVLDESAIDTKPLKEQGVETIAEEVKKEQDAALRENSPVEYYLRKYAVSGILIIGGVIIVGGILKEGARAVIDKKLKAA